MVMNVIVSKVVQSSARGRYCLAVSEDTRIDPIGHCRPMYRQASNHSHLFFSSLFFDEHNILLMLILIEESICWIGCISSQHQNGILLDLSQCGG